MIYVGTYQETDGGKEHTQIEIPDPWPQKERINRAKPPVTNCCGGTCYPLDRQFGSISDLPPLGPKFRREPPVVTTSKTPPAISSSLTRITITKCKQSYYCDMVKRNILMKR